MSFGSSFSSYTPQLFPLYSGSPPIIAPYWTDIDLSNGLGNVRYAVYTTDNGAAYIHQVNAFLANTTEADDFIATTMLVAQWINVYPYGDIQPEVNEVLP